MLNHLWYHIYTSTFYYFHSGIVNTVTNMATWIKSHTHTLNSYSTQRCNDDLRIRDSCFELFWHRCLNPGFLLHAVYLQTWYHVATHMPRWDAYLVLFLPLLFEGLHSNSLCSWFFFLLFLFFILLSLHHGTHAMNRCRLIGWELGKTDEHDISAAPPEREYRDPM